MTSDANIELSKDGIKFSYRRFLSDSTPGYILILIVFLMIYGQISVFGIHFSQTAVNNIPVEIQVYLGLVAFLMATPLGLITNVISWIFLEGFQKSIERCFIMNTDRFLDFKNEYLFADAVKYFHSNKENWFANIRKIETTLVRERPDFGAENIGPLRGISILLRNIAFLGFWILVIDGVFFSANWIEVLAGVLIFLISLIFSAVTSFYFHTQILYWGYLEQIQKNKDSNKVPEPAIITTSI